MMGRPNRSDEHLPTEEEARIEAETREYFDEMAPKRHTKPSRSDPSSDDTPAAAAAADAPIPELRKFQDLEAHSQSQYERECDGSKPAEEEEYMATDYYDDLNCVDKQHHTTGSGFIKMEESKSKSNSNSNSSSNVMFFGAASDANANANANAWSCSKNKKGNPATNDWIPSAPTQTVIVTSNKPNRSDE